MRTAPPARARSGGARGVAQRRARSVRGEQHGGHDQAAADIAVRRRAAQHEGDDEQDSGEDQQPLRSMIGLIIDKKPRRIGGAVVRRRFMKMVPVRGFTKSWIVPFAGSAA